jgi:hypothetical protein
MLFKGIKIWYSFQDINLHSRHPNSDDLYFFQTNILNLAAWIEKEMLIPN